MPATITHAYFANDLYDVLPIGLKKLLRDDKQKLRMFAQSTDPLIFYNLLKRKDKKIRDFQGYFHTNKTGEFLINLINYIKYNNYYKNSEIMAFLYGFISHYILDSKLHPFIIYKTGIFKEDDPNTYKYRNKHEYMENFLDNYMIKQKEGINPHKFKFYDFWYSKDNFSKELIEVIDYAFKETYGIENFSKYYIKSLNDMYKSLKYLRYDKYGIKMFIYKSVDKFTNPKTFKLQGISYHTDLKDKNNYLNANHTTWIHPTTKREKHNESFIELYRIALDETLNMIKEINKYLKDQKKVNLKKLIKNNSYLTGKDCKNKNNLKYFE